MNSIAFQLILMFFLHIVDDYYLQGWLASGKQKEWWENNSPSDFYKKDYIVCLVMHSFSWSFMVMIPVFIKLNFSVGTVAIFVFAINIIIHALTDNMKANIKKINLFQDQSIHIVQIFITWFIFFAL